MFSKTLITTAVVAMSSFHIISVHADDVPSCLPGCLSKATSPCSANSLPLLVTCLNNTCPTSAQEAAAAAVHVSYTPKAEFSCQGSVIPGQSGPQSAPLALKGDGTCVTSPFPFKSFVATGASSAVATSACDFFVYDDADCQGTESKVEWLAGEDEGCQFTGGKSAKLVCQGAQVMTQVARTQLTGMCPSSSTNTTLSSVSATSGYSSAPTTSLESNSTSSIASAPSTSGSASTTISASPTSNSTETTTASASPKSSSSPLTGLACVTRTIDNSIAALAIVGAGLLVL